MSIVFSETASLIVHRGILSCSKEEFEALVARMPLRENRGTITLYGSTYKVPRTQKLFGDTPYVYSRMKLDADPDIDPLVQRCLDFANEEYPDYVFNGALVNLYEDGLDNVGWHSDDESALVKGGPIVSVTFGYARPFKIRTIPRFWDNKTQTWTVVLNSGDVAVMLGDDFQRTLEHQVPKSTKKVPQDVDTRRINITVRAFEKKEATKRLKI